MKNIVYLLVVLVFASCSIKTHYVQTGGKTYPKTEENSILIYSKAPEKQYEVIGSVAVYATSEKLSLKSLKKKAAEIGADAIIEITLDKISSVNQATGISGIAVKFK